MIYQGSKARFAYELYANINSLSPRLSRPWVEPFAGGMNMISVIPDYHGERYASDVNRYLISMWKELVSGWIPPEFVERDDYYQIKDDYKAGGATPDHVIGYVGFNCSYSNKWWGGYVGQFTTKEGLERNYQTEARTNLMKQVPGVIGVELECCSYLDRDYPDDAIIYCDPPYSGTTGYKDSIDHEQFWDWVREKSERHDVWVSEYSAPDDFECVWQKETASMLSQLDDYPVVVEKLFRKRP